MLKVLTNFMLNTGAGTAYTLLSNSADEKQVASLSRGMFDVITDNIYKIAFYNNSLVEDTADCVTLVYQAIVQGQPAKVRCSVRLGAMDTIVSIQLVGFETCTSSGKIILTDSLESKAIYSERS